MEYRPLTPEEQIDYSQKAGRTLHAYMQMFSEIERIKKRNRQRQLDQLGDPAQVVINIPKSRLSKSSEEKNDINFAQLINRTLPLVTQYTGVLNGFNDAIVEDEVRRRQKLQLKINEQEQEYLKSLEAVAKKMAEDNSTPSVDALCEGLAYGLFKNAENVSISAGALHEFITDLAAGMAGKPKTDRKKERTNEVMNSFVIPAGLTALLRHKLRFASPPSSDLPELVFNTD